MINGATFEEDDGHEGSRVTVDARLVERPPRFDGSESLWKDWRFRMENWLGLIDRELPSLLMAAAVMDNSVPLQAGRRGKLCDLLFVILSTQLEGPALRQLQLVPDRNGFEAWRRICLEMEPRAAHRKLLALDKLLHPALVTTSSSAFLDSWRAWEKDVLDYEEYSGHPFDKEVQAAILVRHVPDELRKHLQLSASEHLGNYEMIKTRVITYIQSQKMFEGTAIVPMECDFLQGAGKKGSGKSTGKQRPGECWNCGKAGHVARDCPKKKPGDGKPPSKPGARKRYCSCCGKHGHMGKNCFKRKLVVSELTATTPGGGQAADLSEVVYAVEASPNDQEQELARSSDAEEAVQSDEEEVEIPTEVCMIETPAGAEAPAFGRPPRAGAAMLSTEAWRRKITRREPVAFVIDSGSMINALPVQAVQAMNLQLKVRKPLVVRGAGGLRLMHFGQVRVRLWCQGWSLYVIFEIVAPRDPLSVGLA